MIGSQDVCSGFFVTQRYVTQASQSSWDRRAELDVFLATPSAQSACGMEDFMKVVDMHCDTIAALYENKEKAPRKATHIQRKEKELSDISVKSIMRAARG